MQKEFNVTSHSCLLKCHTFTCACRILFESLLYNEKWRAHDIINVHLYKREFWTNFYHIIEGYTNLGVDWILTFSINNKRNRKVVVGSCVDQLKKVPYSWGTIQRIIRKRKSSVVHFVRFPGHRFLVEVESSYCGTDSSRQMTNCPLIKNPMYTKFFFRFLFLNIVAGVISLNQTDMFPLRLRCSRLQKSAVNMQIYGLQHKKQCFCNLLA